MTIGREREYVIAVDSGGTFTDCVAIAADGAIARGKAPSTPPDFERGVLDAVGTVADELGLSRDGLLRRAWLFAHGTTIATNALLTRSGSQTGLLTTVGHEDAVLIGRIHQKVAGLSESQRADVARLDKPRPIVPRELIAGVAERVDRDGEVVAPLDLDSVRRALDEFIEHGVESVAVSLLWSFRNPENEDAIARLIEGEYTGLVCSVSHQIAPVIGEYERGITTALNAYLRRRTESYMDHLAAALAREGFTSDPVVMQSSGGVQDIGAAKTMPVGLLTSGPAGGVVGAQVLGRRLGLRNVITTDVGGTSFDVGLIVDGEIEFSNQTTIEQFDLARPVIDVATIGAGGGSIAWIEPDTSVLRVGPQSAGAVPGPACYGLGGTEPTVTDANLVLGRLNPDYFLGGRRRLDVERAREAVGRLAERLDMSLSDLAVGIVEIVDAHMADLVRKVTIERGFDPREFALFAFGGAGPVHACAYGFDAQCSQVVVPAMASEFSAFGIGGSELMVVEERSDPTFEPFDGDRFSSTFASLERAATERLQANGVDADAIALRRFVRMRYRGQVHEVDTPAAEGRIGATGLERLVAEFEALYEQKYGRGTSFRRAGMQAITFRVHGYGRLPTPELAVLERANGKNPVKERRPVFFSDARDFVTTPIYDAAVLAPGHELSGPAIVEAPDTTLVVHPGQSASMDEYGDLVVVAA